MPYKDPEKRNQAKRDYRKRKKAKDKAEAAALKRKTEGKRATVKRKSNKSKQRLKVGVSEMLTTNIRSISGMVDRVADNDSMTGYERSKLLDSSVRAIDKLLVCADRARRGEFEDEAPAEKQKIKAKPKRKPKGKNKIIRAEKLFG